MTKLKPSQRQAERAEYLFPLYYQLGMERSLEKLKELLDKIGMKISMATLGTYSSRYNWQTRVIETDNKLRQEREHDLIEKTLQMNQEQEKIGKAMESLGISGLKHWQSKVDANGMLKLSVGELTSLIDAGVKHRRLALGAPTDRKEIAVTMKNNVIQKIANIFIQVNGIDDPQKRLAEFAHRVDEELEGVLG